MKHSLRGSRVVATVSACVLGAIASAAGQRAADPPIPNLAGRVLTVAGPIDPASLGRTLMHEHIFIDFKAPPAMMPPVTGISVLRPAVAGGRGGGLTDYAESLAEVVEFKKAGGGTIVDTTNFGLTRDPDALLRISKESGLHVVMGAGWYQKALHPPDMTERSVDELAAIIVRDVTVGAQGTTVRSGIIGEVGIQGRPLTENELKSIRASARAARLTGAPMTLHSFATPDEMLSALDIIASEGVELSRVVMSHTGGRDMEYMKRLFARGVYVEYDYIGQAPLTAQRNDTLIQNIADVIAAGYVSQLLIAHDICTMPQLKKNGGGGYTYITSVILPGLKARGVSDADLNTILIDNPRRVLTFTPPLAP